MSESALSTCYTMRQLLKRLREIGNGYRGKDAQCKAYIEGGILTLQDRDVKQMYSLRTSVGDLSAFGIQAADYCYIHAVWEGVHDSLYP